MPRMLFVNLPVADLAASRRFYEALGFTINPQFSDETAACVVVSEAIYFMILTHEKFESFATLPRPDATATTGAMYALSCDSRAAVDAMTQAALAHGGRETAPVRDLGFMYNRTFTDPDGHVFEPMWMDPAAGAGG